MVALAMVSELGPIMTAIVVAGRSGSAFAASRFSRSQRRFSIIRRTRPPIPAASPRTRSRNRRSFSSATQRTAAAPDPAGDQPP